MEIHKSVEEFNSFVATAQPNSKFVYFIGETLTFSILSNEIRRIVWESAIRGEVYLLQKKLGVGRYEFWAVRASNPPNPKLVPINEKANTFAMRIQSYSNRKVPLLERAAS